MIGKRSNDPNRMWRRQDLLWINRWGGRHHQTGEGGEEGARQKMIVPNIVAL